MAGYPRCEYFDMQTFTVQDIAGMDLLTRIQFATSLPGAKPISLIGTADVAGQCNLAPFSSLLHLGSSPCLLGMVSRPDHVDRHTLANLIGLFKKFCTAVPREGLAESGKAGWC